MSKQSLEKRLTAIEKRNHRVERDKAWETSKARIFTITAITYALAALLLHIIQVENHLTGALVPTLGYFLSTQSLPIVREIWEKNS